MSFYAMVILDIIFVPGIILSRSLRFLLKIFFLYNSSSRMDSARMACGSHNVHNSSAERDEWYCDFLLYSNRLLVLYIFKTAKFILQQYFVGVDYRFFRYCLHHVPLACQAPYFFVFISNFILLHTGQFAVSK